MKTFFQYSNDIENFICEDIESIFGKLCMDNGYDPKPEQRNSWKYEIGILKSQLVGLSGRIILEYTIPRVGTRIDAVVITGDIIFVIEFKFGANNYIQSAMDQVYYYAYDLHNFHKESKNCVIVPILVASEAIDAVYSVNDEIIKSNGKNLSVIINDFLSSREIRTKVDLENWENSDYKPTPTIIEAAQRLYSGHEVESIINHEADNLAKTTSKINEIIEYSKYHKKKSICFVTGVPGAGKTLVGLNLASSRQNLAQDEHAVFLSGNGPLVEVLQESLIRDAVRRSNQDGKKADRKKIHLDVCSFVQIVHKYRDDLARDTTRLPHERIVIFDEAQRAWDKKQICNFMKQKKGYADFDFSEPEFLISTMDRFEDWAVIVCLVGGGQEIYKGEAGIIEWLESIKRRFKNWEIYLSNTLLDKEYLNGKTMEEISSGQLKFYYDNDLHLSTSIRSYRSDKLSEFIKALLDKDQLRAKDLYQQIKNKYPIRITRNLKNAKKFISEYAKETDRTGIVASSRGQRLRAEGLYVMTNIDVPSWFLNELDDVRSSNFLEVVASEFKIQGLEIDYAIVAWDADLRANNDGWEFYNFRGSAWNKISDKNSNEKNYLLNAYRVLLTRARQGMVIFVPLGNNEDKTRQIKYYDGIYKYLRDVGIEEI